MSEIKNVTVQPCEFRERIKTYFQEHEVSANVFYCNEVKSIFNKAKINNKAMKVKIINTSTNPLPAYATVGSAGMDLVANIERPIVIKPNERVMIPTGIYIELPIGYEAQIRPRSGLAFKKGLTIPNSPATIDSDYRGEIKVVLINLSNEPQTIEIGERIGQMIIARHEIVEWDVVETLTDSKRGTGGFGSTGTVECLGD